MSYIIGQYNHNRDSGDDSSYISLITEGTARRRQNQGDVGVISSSLDIFSDECLQTTLLSPANYYYCKCQIKRLSSEQIFTIKLVNYETTSTNNVEQYLKTITIQGGQPNEWVNVEFIFHPVVQFDSILFQLQRGLDDYRVAPRYPKIAYQELGVINNIIPMQIRNNITLLKIGVQSHPGLVMCINGEEIHTARSGIYEMKNGILPVSFFSVVKAAQENTNTVQLWLDSVGQQSMIIEEELAEGLITPEQAANAYAAIDNQSFLSTSKTVKIDPFILDYMFKE